MQQYPVSAHLLGQIERGIRLALQLLRGNGLFGRLNRDPDAQGDMA
jgi:hypothetical protein